MIESYFIHKDGEIITLTFNTKGRWIEFVSRNDSLYEFVDHDRKESCQLEVPEMEAILGNKSHMVYQSQEKDQIYFLFMPFDMVPRALVGEVVQNPPVEKIPYESD